MKEEIKKLIEKFTPEGTDFSIEHPTDFGHGDYSTNVAMVLAKSSDEKPIKIAEKIVADLNKIKPIEIEKIDIAGPGFINFYLSADFFYDTVKKIIENGNDFGKNSLLKGQKFAIDYTDPNPFKQFHIGHLMSNAIGEAVAKITEWNGADVTRICYSGDVGLHVAKAIWGMQIQADAFPHDVDSIQDKVRYVGESYVYGASQYEEDEKAKNEIDELNKKIYELYSDNPDQELKIYYDKGKKWSLEHFEEIYKILGTHFDEYVFESETYKKGEEIVRENVPEIFELSDGAIIYRGEKDGLHTRVFINSNGLPTYEAKDIGLALHKETIGDFDKSIIVTASEQKEYFKVVLSALKNIAPNVAEKTQNITHGMMKFKEGKMSSRTGNVITGESLLQDVGQMVTVKISDRDFDESESEKIKNIVSVGAIKYSILKQAPGKDIIFDPEKSISFEGDSGPYLQYTYTRAKSVLEKAADQGIKIENFEKPINWQTTNLEMLLYRFPEIVSDSVKDFSIQNITTFITQIASEFNSFYGNNQILGSNEEKYKIALTMATSQVIKNGLEILGIKVPQKM